MNQIDSTIYFSGTWQPYQRAARFAFYPDSVEVRARWDIEGILIKFDSGNIASGRMTIWGIKHT